MGISVAESVKTTVEKMEAADGFMKVKGQQILVNSRLVTTGRLGEASLPFSDSL